MANVTDLIQFIKNSKNEHSAEWYSKLLLSVPDWRNIVADPQNWEAIEGVTSLVPNCYGLLRKLAEPGGLELAKRWFYSDISEQKSVSRDWLRNNVSMWHEFDGDIKNELIEHTFKQWPGEPFKTLERYSELAIHMQYTIELGYVPSPQIEKLRFIIEDAGDQVYLSRIDGMISRREEACKVAFQQQRRIPYTPNSNERELIARVMEITRESGYLSTALPPIFVSYETPPIFIAYPELEEEDDEYQIRRNRDQRRDEEQIPRNRERRKPETISIEELLGVYQSQHQQIVIYERGVKWSTHRHQLDAEWLCTVVLIHEIGHWITHVLPKPGVPTWSTDLFALSEADLKEGWAQLITWWIAAQVGGPFRHTFEKLNQNQSSPYRVFEDFKDEPIDKVMESLERLRHLSWPGRLQDWKGMLR